MTSAEISFGELPNDVQTEFNEELWTMLFEVEIPLIYNEDDDTDLEMEFRKILTLPWDDIEVSYAKRVLPFKTMYSMVADYKSQSFAMNKYVYK